MCVRALCSSTCACGILPSRGSLDNKCFEKMFGFPPQRNRVWERVCPFAAFLWPSSSWTVLCSDTCVLYIALCGVRDCSVWPCQNQLLVFCVLVALAYLRDVCRMYVPVLSLTRRRAPCPLCFPPNTFAIVLGANINISKACFPALATLYACQGFWRPGQLNKPSGSKLL